MNTIQDILIEAGYEKPRKSWKTDAINKAIENGVSIYVHRKGYVKTTKLKSGKDFNYNVQIKFNGINNVNKFSSHVAITDFLTNIITAIGNVSKRAKIETTDCNCSRCNGKGIIPQFLHYADGVCFDCLGTGYKLK